MTAFGTASPPLLHVDGLSVDFLTEGRWTRVVDDVSYDVRAGEIVGLVGESGSGKSVSSLAVMRLLSPRNSRTSARRSNSAVNRCSISTRPRCVRSAVARSR